MTRVHTIVSGGQAGGDQGGLRAAINLGLATGGWAPRGWRTETGPAPWLAKLGLQEHASPSYPPRTLANVLLGDGTLIFGDEASPGCRLTRRLCRENDKPCFVIPWSSRVPTQSPVTAFQAWLARHDIQVLNVAGNREASQPGIENAVVDFLTRALAP